MEARQGKNRDHECNLKFRERYLMKQVEKSEERDEESSIVHADDVRESFKLGFEAVKHLTTLSAGSFVLIATFLDRIFPNRLVKDDKVLIALSFLCFAVSLVISVYSLWRLATMVRSRRSYERKKPKIRFNIVAPSLCYVFGLGFFGTAVLANVFFGADEGARNAVERSWQWVPLGTFLFVVMLVFIGRYKISSMRDKDTPYEIVYPDAEKCDVLNKQSEHATDSGTDDKLIRWGGWAAMAAGMVWGVSGILAVAYKGVQAPDTFAFYLIIGIFIVALVLTVMGMVVFRTELQHRRNGRRIEGVAYYTVIAALVGQVLCALVLWAVGIPVARALGLYGMNVLFGLLWLALGGYVLFSKVRADPAPQ
jgi:hypothetical protein